MSDSGSSSINGEARMLERRVSNNRGDLSGDGQMNYFLAWFNTWSELQKSDFVSVLADKMANGSGGGGINGLSGKVGGLNLSQTDGGRPPSLFACQIKLFQDWFGGWSDDQKNYLVMRLKDIDAEFFAKYEEFVSNPESGVKEKDYFEPGVPEELVRHSNLNSLQEKSSDLSAGDGDLKKPAKVISEVEPEPLKTISEDA